VYVNYVLGVIFVVTIFNIVDRTVTSILLEDIRKELELDDLQLGVLQGLAFSIVYTIASLPIAYWADRGVRRSIVALGLVAWSAATAVTAFVGNFAQLLAARMAVGIGEAAGSAPSQSLISDYVPAERRARALSVISIGSIAGLAIGQIAGGWLGEWYGWRSVFLIVGLPGIAVALLMRLSVREPERSQRETASFATSLRTMLGQPSFRWLLVAGTFALLASMGRNLWEPTFLRRIYGYDAGAAGTWYFLIGPLPAAFGIYLGARLGDRLGHADARWYLWIPVIGQILATPLQTAFVLWPESMRVDLPGGLPELPVGFLFSIAGAVFGSLFTAPVLAITISLVPANMRAQAAAVSTGFHGLIGHGLGPFLVGALSRWLEPSHGVYALRYALLLATLTPIVSAVFFALGARTVRADKARVSS
jgi:predicted MFS family arabinose efflux permease